MSSCEYIGNCPIFGKTQTGLLDRIFVMKYCEGRHLEQCKRRILKKEGKEVPRTMLPSGIHLQSLAGA